MRTPHVLLAIVIAAASACSDDPAAEEAATTPSPSNSQGAATTAPPASTSEAPDSGATTTSGPPPPSSTADASQPGTTAGSVPTSNAPPPEPVVGEPVVAAELVATLDQPVGLAVRPGDGAAYVVEQDGRVVRVVPVSGGEAETAVVADVTDRTGADGERGLLGLAFAADGARAWLDYTDGAGDTVVAEYPVSPDGTFDVGAERVLLTVDQPYPNHNGGDLALGPDGMLYIALGDGGSGGDPERRASDPENLLGKLLRIDPNGSGDQPYAIPADNPFAGGSFGDVAGAPEVWAWGLRNPWRFDFDEANGNLWIADVGQNAIEEINLVSATADHTSGWGANFGWSAFEGTERYNDDVADPGDLVFPVWTYTHAEGCSVSGGAVYRGAVIAGLAPAFVYSDYCSGTVWAFDPVSGRNLVLLEGLQQVTAVRGGPDGELYVLEASGGVHRLVQG